jgi:hypothetical protein
VMGAGAVLGGGESTPMASRTPIICYTSNKRTSHHSDI